MSDEIEVFCGRDGFSVDTAELAAILRKLNAFAPWHFPAGTLSVAFLGDDEICRLHQKFLSDPTETDVITFPGDEIFSAPRPRAIDENPRGGNDEASRGGNDENPDGAEAFAGEICICVDRAVRIAREMKTTPDDEILLYFVHGWLHLAGFDDIADEDRVAMRSAEATLLTLLHAENLAPLRSAKFDF